MLHYTGCRPLADSWVGDNMEIVIEGVHENSWRVTMAEPAAFSRDDARALEVEFDQPPRIAVAEKRDAGG